MSKTSLQAIAAARMLSDSVECLKFRPPVTHVYNPLRYAWAAHELYLSKHAGTRKRVVFLGMNPGPFGMAQTGVPFGEIAAVRDWIGVVAAVGQPKTLHHKRPIDGFACTRSEVSGRRLWGLFAERYVTAKKFFAEHFVANYCPLVFMDEGGRNLTPDKFPASDATPLYEVCDQHLRSIVVALNPEWVIGVGDFAEKRAREALAEMNLRFGKVLHPSPASPAANRGWSSAATRQLVAQGVWT